VCQQRRKQQGIALHLLATQSAPARKPAPPLSAATLAASRLTCGDGGRGEGGRGMGREGGRGGKDEMTWETNAEECRKPQPHLQLRAPRGIRRDEALHVAVGIGGGSLRCFSEREGSRQAMRRQRGTKGRGGSGAEAACGPRSPCRWRCCSARCFPRTARARGRTFFSREKCASFIGRGW
jgi:hypothetical protein